MKSVLFLVLIFSSAISFAVDLKSPKTVLMNWLDDNSHSVIQLDHQLTTEMFGEYERVSCNTQQPQPDHVRAFYGPYQMKFYVDLNLYSVPSVVSMCSNDLCYFFNYVSYPNFDDCQARNINSIKSVTITVGDTYPNDRHKGFLFRWNITKSTVQAYVLIEGESIYGNKLKLVGKGKILLSY